MYFFFILLLVRFTLIASTDSPNPPNYHAGSSSNLRRTYYNEEYLLDQVDFASRSVALNNLRTLARVGLPSFDGLRLFKEYLLSYDRRLKGPAWVMQQLTQKKINQIDTKAMPFWRDPEMGKFSTRLSDYKGYHVGQMASGKDFFSPDSVEESLYLSNAWPQAKQLNTVLWSQLEEYARRLASHPAVLVYVVSGPLFRPCPNGSHQGKYVHYIQIGESNISVPTHFFKVILVRDAKGNQAMDAFVLPNSERPEKGCLDLFRIPLRHGEFPDLDDLELETGLIFFREVDRSQIPQMSHSFCIKDV